MFFDFSIMDFVDILLVAALLYYLYKLMKESGSINIFTGILVFIVFSSTGIRSGSPHTVCNS